MNELYRFSPIKDEDTPQKAFSYITSELVGKKINGHNIKYLGVRIVD